MMSGVMPNCSWQKNVPLRPMPGLDLVEDHQRLVLAAQGLRLEPELVGREVDALALDGLDHEGGDVAPPQLAGARRRCRRRGSCRPRGAAARTRCGTRGRR